MSFDYRVPMSLQRVVFCGTVRTQNLDIAIRESHPDLSFLPVNGGTRDEIHLVSHIHRDNTIPVLSPVTLIRRAATTSLYTAGDPLCSVPVCTSTLLRQCQRKVINRSAENCVTTRSRRPSVPAVLSLAARRSAGERSDHTPARRATFQTTRQRNTILGNIPENCDVLSASVGKGTTHKKCIIPRTLIALLVALNCSAQTVIVFRVALSTSASSGCVIS